MDMGVYCVHPLLALFGMPKEVVSSCVKVRGGIDGHGTFLAVYEELLAEVSYSKIANSTMKSEIIGEDGVMVIDDMISTGHARAILSIENPEEQYTLAQRIFDEKLSVRDVEKLVKNLNKPKIEKPKKEKNESLEIIYQERANKLKDVLGTKVAVSSKGDGAGKIEIEFFSHEDFDRLMEMLIK